MSSNITFTEKDYESGDGMLTSIWGPPLWHVLHTMSFNYPVHPSDEQKKYYYNFIQSLQYVLPCKYCRTNLEENFKKNKPLLKKHLKSRLKFSTYIYELHELINTQTGKPPSNLTYQDIVSTYENFRARCLDETKSSNKNKHIKGCTDSLYGLKGKCVLRIIPKKKKMNHPFIFMINVLFNEIIIHKILVYFQNNISL